MALKSLWVELNFYINFLNKISYLLTGIFTSQLGFTSRCIIFHTETFHNIDKKFGTSYVAPLTAVSSEVIETVLY